MVGSFGDMAYQVFMVTKKKMGGGVGFNGGITVTCNAIFKICNCNQV